MTAGIVFIDTSILCNLVRVHGKDQHRIRITREMRERVTSGETFILPVTAVIETGNHIAQSGDHRYEAAQRLADYLRLIREGRAPWVLHEMEWDAQFLQTFLEGASSGRDWPSLAAEGIGAGDVCILAEAERYQRRVGGTVSVWTLDSGLEGLAVSALTAQASSRIQRDQPPLSTSQASSP